MGYLDGTSPWVNPDTGLLGVPGNPATSQPVIPSFEQYSADLANRARWQSLGDSRQGAIGRILGGLGLTGPDPAANYNDLLKSAQGAEQGRISTAYYDGVNGMPGASQGAAPVMQAAPAQAPSGPLLAPPQPSQGGGGLLNPNAAPPQVPQMQPQAGAPVMPPPGIRAPVPAANGSWGPGNILQQVQTAMRVPALAGAIPAYVGALTQTIENGKTLNPDGSISLTPGAAQAQTLLALAKAHISTGGVNPMDPSSVNAAVAGQAGATAGAEQGAKNASDLFYKPKIAAGEAEAKLPATFAEAGNKAWLEALGKWVVPTETRPGNDVVQFSGTGAPQLSQFMPGGGVGSTTGPIPTAGQPSTLYSNNGETFKTGQELAGETAQSRVAAEGAYTQRAIYGKMLETLPNANLGSQSAERTAMKNWINTYTGFDMSKSVTQDQVFDKLATQVAGQATKQLDQTAVAALETMRKAYPNRDMTPQALREMVGQLSGLQDYIIAKDQARQAHIDKNHTASGFTQGEWVRQNTPEKFIEQGIIRTIPEPARNALAANPKLAADFDKKYGVGTSRLVLGGQ